VGKPERKKSHERPKSRWGDNTKMDLQEVGRYMDWIDLAQHRDRWQGFVCVLIKLRVP
jgi:hypothetical protein